MFQKFIKEFDESMEEGFVLFIIFLTSTSRLKLIFFYLYTFTMEEEGEYYRKHVRMISFPYYLMYKLRVGIYMRRLEYLKMIIFGKNR